MMNYLEKLYSYEYFPQILFGTIAVLLILLIIVILFGKKDEKIRKEEETKRLELAGLDAFAEVQSEPIPVEVPIAEGEPFNTFEDINQEDSFSVVNDEQLDIQENIEAQAQDLVNSAINNSVVGVPESIDVPTPTERNDSLMMPDFEIFQEEKKVEANNSAIEEEVPLSLSELHQKDDIVSFKENDIDLEENKFDATATLPEFNFEELASSINKELDEINKLQEQAVKEDEIKELPGQVDVTPIKEVAKFTPSSVFSSVYVNKERDIKSVIEEEATAETIENKPILEEKAEEEIPVIKNIINEPMVEERSEDVKVEPVKEVVQKPTISNPFIFDMPAKKEEKKEESVNVEKTIVTTNVPDFSSFENETYDIK